MYNRLEDKPDYFCWLSEMVCVDGRYTDESYWILAEALWDIDYFWILERDENRAKSVDLLRNRYLLDGGKERYEGKPNVLEVLVMLSDVMFDMLDELDGEDRRPMYFWEMIENLGLSDFTDQVYEELPNRRAWFYRRIKQRISVWLERKFDYNGFGSPFPLENPREDQAEVELWYQMQYYVVENY